MLLTQAHVTKFRSIEDSTVVDIDREITAFVGQNESGKTAFLQALYRARPADKGAEFDLTEDYPRHELLDYETEHAKNPAVAVTLTYELEPEDVEAFRAEFSVDAVPPRFTVKHKYDGGSTIILDWSKPEQEFVRNWRKSADLSSEAHEAIKNAKTVDEILTALAALDLNEGSQAEADKLAKRFADTNWSSRFGRHCWMKVLLPRVPRFMYFDDYRILPGKVNLPDLIARRDSGKLTPQQQGVLRLLQVARVDVDSLAEPGGYERGQARLEATSNKITSRVFKYWQQNRDLQVIFDVKDDPDDAAPFNNGKNLYIRVRNPKHGVTVPFDQRSKGFIWFFSFMAWFDSLQRTDDHPDAKLILLLDEPGLSLHALAQADYLRYIDELSAGNQILYSTHSPFMIDSKRLDRARTVEDRKDVGSLVSGHISGSSNDTLFPLQAALGYSIAQNLFVAERNLLVEGISELVLLQAMSDRLESAGREGLHPSITITPTGGVGKVAAFVSLFGANDLQLVVLHDYSGSPEQTLDALVHEKLLSPKQILHFGSFRPTGGPVPTDLEDMVPRGLYLKAFNDTFGQAVKVGDLGDEHRVVQALGRHLKKSGINLRPSGGFNHFLVAKTLASADWKLSEDALLDNFERVFAAVNKVFTTG